MNTLERLQGMVNKPYLYRNEEVVVLGYCEGTGDDGDEVEIYLNNGKTLVFNYINLPAKLEQFKPVTTQVIVLANKRLDAVSTVNPWYHPKAPVIRYSSRLRMSNPLRSMSARQSRYSRV